MPERGFIHHFPLLLVALLAIAAAVFFLVSKGSLKLPFFDKQPKVEIQTKYENPFNKETQFVNPFDQYKNPFTVNR